VKPLVVVTSEIPDSACEILRTHGTVRTTRSTAPHSAARLHDTAAGAFAVVTVPEDRVDAAFFDAVGPQLRLVANVAVGFDNVDIAEAGRRRVHITNTPGVLTEATADLTMALILAITRRLVEGDRIVRSRGPWLSDFDFMLGTGLQGKTLGIVGLGAIGSATARRGRAFGMEIAFATDVPPDPAIVAELEAKELLIGELAAVADVLSLHCPLTETTRHLIDRRLLRMMKPTAFLINAARGPIVDEVALVDALRAGTIRGAGLDVFEDEPDVNPGLLELDNVVLVPHIGSATLETRTAMAELAARNVVAVIGGKPPITPVGACLSTR
jgi:lactate dehydrogenase-like 2-hydroxyacid dehydrogenase